MATQKNVQPAPVLEAMQGDEIDLFELVTKIWAGRLLIGGLVLIVAVIAFIGLKLAPSYYKIETTIDLVPKEQLRPLFPTTLGSVDYQVPSPDETKVYNKVLLQVSSIGTLRSFWESRTGKPLPEDLRIGGDDVNEFRKFADYFVLEAPNAKTPTITARKISVEAKSRTEGVKLLNEYLDFLAQETWKDQVEQLQTSYNASLKVLAANYSNKTLIEERKLNDTLIGFKESLKIASSMGIYETPFRQLENIQLKVMDSRDYLLGTKSLSAQIEILTARQGKSLAPYSGELRNMENMRDQINSDMNRLKELKGKLKLFAVVNEPEASLDPIKPKKALIFIGLVFLAGILGVITVLIRSAIATRKASEAKAA